MVPNDTGIILGFLLVDTARLYRQQFEKAVLEAGLELTPGEIRTLLHVARHEGSRQVAIADRMGVEPMTLSSYLDRLEAHGLVARSADTKDRRAKVVRTTDAANAVFTSLRPVMIDLFHHVTQDLSEDECRDLEESLRKIRGSMTIEPLISASQGVRANSSIT